MMEHAYKKKWKSKGQTHGPLIGVLEFVISLTAVFLLLQIGYNITSGTHNQELYAIFDIVFTSEAVDSTHLNMDYFYPLESFAPFVYSFHNNILSMRGVEKDLQEISYPIITTKKSILKGNFTNPKGLIISKQGGILSIHNYSDVTTNYNKEDCDDLPVITSPLFVLDPGHGGDDQGIVSGDKKEAEITREIAKSVNGLFGNLLLTRDLDAEQTVSLEQKQKQINDYSDRIGGIISIHLNQEENKRNNFIFYINAKNEKYSESRAIACHILNELVTYFPQNINGAAIIPIDLTLTPSEDALQILSSSAPGVLIEIGNIDYDTNPALQKKDDVGKVIGKILKQTWKPEGVPGVDVI